MTLKQIKNPEHPLSAAYWVEKLNLSEHPEGGYFRETYRSKQAIDCSAINDGFKGYRDGYRDCCTAIYFLLKADQVSKFHRIKSDEIWHFYAGDPLTLAVLNHADCHEFMLSSNIEDKQFFSLCVPAGLWFGAFHQKEHINAGYSLLACTLSKAISSLSDKSVI